MDRLALINGKIYVEKGVFAQALWAEDGIIRGVGKNEDVPTEYHIGTVIDCGGKTVVPGFSDSHMHLLMAGIGMAQANIACAASAEHLVELGKTYLETHPQAAVRGIQAMGWNQDLFAGDKRLPTRWDLDRISPDIPIIMERICGHMAVVNSKVLELMGIHRDAPQFPGGTWEKDENGEVLSAGSADRICIDFTGKKSGRGAYICRKEECLAKARKTGRLKSSLECEITDAVYDELAKEIRLDEASSQS